MTKLKGRTGTATHLVDQNPGRKRPEVRGHTKDQIVGAQLRRRKEFERYTPEYREWLLRQEAKGRGKRV